MRRVRWLSRSACINRLKVIYPKLLEYFRGQSNANVKGAEALYDKLR